MVKDPRLDSLEGTESGAGPRVFLTQAAAMRYLEALSAIEPVPEEVADTINELKDFLGSYVDPAEQAKADILSGKALDDAQKVIEGVVGECCYDRAWIGRCKNKAVAQLDGKLFCIEHEFEIQIRNEFETCIVCKGKATRQCGHAGSLVCGAPLCSSCSHVH